MFSHAELPARTNKFPFVNLDLSQGTVAEMQHLLLPDAVIAADGMIRLPPGTEWTELRDDGRISQLQQNLPRQCGSAPPFYLCRLLEFARRRLLQPLLVSDCSGTGA